MSFDNYAIDYSVLICTYNPDQRLLQRCLVAVKDLQRNGITTEVILIDNNSTPALQSTPYIQHYLNQVPDMQLLNVTQQGLSYARMGGIAAARGKYIVFFDDDNEPDSAYLLALQQLHAQYPQVTAWGPGQVQVDFIDGVDPALEPIARPAFQERHEEKVAFAAAHEWQACYPFGTGLCMPAATLKGYIDGGNAGRFTLTDRNGESLSSGGDTQMVLFGIQSGGAAGIAPALKITHIIPGKRTSPAYLKRLAYSTSLCYATCVAQVFPEYRQQVISELKPPAKFSRQSFKKFLRLLLAGNTLKQCRLAAEIGDMCGRYLLLQKPVPGLVRMIIRLMKLD